MWPFKKKPKDVGKTGVEQSWTMFHGEFDGKPLIARANAGLKPHVGHPNYSHHVGVSIPFQNPDQNGFPQSDEAAELMNIEDKICAELEIGNQSLFAAVITTNGMREFVFYTSNPEAVQTKLEKLKGEIRSHSVQVIIKHDANWNTYREFV
jgi:hypothetical protein